MFWACRYMHLNPDSEYRHWQRVIIEKGLIGVAPVYIPALISISLPLNISPGKIT